MNSEKKPKVDNRTELGLQLIKHYKLRKVLQDKLNAVNLNIDRMEATFYNPPKTPIKPDS